MGPYCKFCGQRCFCHLPQETPREALDAYGTSTIIATCPVGQAFEMEKVGWCYDKIQEAIRAAAVANFDRLRHRPAPDPTDDAAWDRFACEIWDAAEEAGWNPKAICEAGFQKAMAKIRQEQEAE